MKHYRSENLTRSRFSNRFKFFERSPDRFYGDSNEPFRSTTEHIYLEKSIKKQIPMTKYKFQDNMRRNDIEYIHNSDISTITTSGLRNRDLAKMLNDMEI